MLGKKSGLNTVMLEKDMNILELVAQQKRQRYLHLEKKEKRLHRAFIWEKSKMYFEIVPQTEKCKTLEIDKKCIKRRLNK